MTGAKCRCIARSRDRWEENMRVLATVAAIGLAGLLGGCKKEREAPTSDRVASSAPVQPAAKKAPSPEPVVEPEVAPRTALKVLPAAAPEPRAAPEPPSSPTLEPVVQPTPAAKSESDNAAAARAAPEVVEAPNCKSPEPPPPGVEYPGEKGPELPIEELRGKLVPAAPAPQPTEAPPAEPSPADEEPPAPEPKKDGKNDLRLQGVWAVDYESMRKADPVLRDMAKETPEVAKRLAAELARQTLRVGGGSMERTLPDGPKKAPYTVLEDTEAHVVVETGAWDRDGKRVLTFEFVDDNHVRALPPKEDVTARPTYFVRGVRGVQEKQ